MFQKTIGVNDWYNPGGDNHYPLGNVQGLGKLQGAMVKNARRMIPKAILDAVTHRTLDLFLQTEDLPLTENRVTLGSDGRLVLARRATNLSAHRELVKRMKAVSRKAGYPSVAVNPALTVASLALRVAESGQLTA
ncbi:hypothetical protein [Streptomyces sp. 5-10]|uniref:hypothetical protein n=1 Tax=Streptomyces sp. 5-10 TaxID=878925 RepID=UPI00168B467D|nr:hypothetical protein [Streptomyces sp. 5-10]MBD3003483.1 hypothetical protein [Streptomyces sp. 5-10]